MALHPCTHAITTTTDGNALSNKKRSLLHLQRGAIACLRRLIELESSVVATFSPIPAQAGMIQPTPAPKRPQPCYPLQSRDRLVK
ncbi:hypothetical protein [Trichocoleus sp. FACHB-262]|uniref:hypothetical protein n=1 Tax=Trichocoleus sp. FACHB-262 TaxID=2692869 RepID=UPI0016858BC6|nr:hypothetical protein [Trichocoleus sp. FACHB-262]MBD2123259.1 hypothetical protein [Trichocoleus sp. FACHB-262]